CLDSENKSIMGNIKDQSIKEMWNSERYMKFRKLHTERRFSEIPLCNTCESYRELTFWDEI
ncbi:unnamed protein product, partial [marine sediment metagenome]